jgi:4'-phosphopantetheinyl transferase
MIDLWYLDTINVSRSDMEPVLKSLPIEVRGEISRFRNHEDRRLKLCGRLIVKEYHESINMKFSWSNWRTTPNGKPFYSGGKKFSISHSGCLVAVAFCDTEIGIDIEKCANIDIPAMIDYFHIQEKKFITDSDDTRDAFFTVWTRKEAYLKAKGIGIVEGLNRENCLEPSIGIKDRWFLRSLSIANHYKLAVCSQIRNIELNQLQLHPTILLSS